jgi:HlyD family secretion protein
MKKIIAITFIVLVAGLTGYLVWKKNGNSGIAEAAAPTATVERGPIRLVVESTGRIVSNLDIEVMSEADGEVIQLPYDVSDAVEKGALLAELDPVDEERRVRLAQVDLLSAEARLAQASESLLIAERQITTDLARARAEIASASAQYADARAKAERMRKLLETKRVSEEECETAETAAALAAAKLQTARVALEEVELDRQALEIKRQDVLLAEAALESRKVDLELARQRLEDTRVFAPMSGVVSERNVQIGQIISSPMNNVGGGTRLLTLSDLSQIFVLASVDESDIGKVEVGQPVETTADAFPGEYFRGQVERIATRGETVSNVVTFEVKIEILGPNRSKLKPEMTANVEIIAAETENALLLPSEAVQRAGFRSFVLVAGSVEAGSGELHPVRSGIDNGFQIEILDGLEEGDRVIISTEMRSRWAKQESGPSGDHMRTRMMMRGMRGRR